MKQILSILLAIVLIPAGQSFAWIGGPFSNNTYFGERGDDGIYEAVAVPLGVFNGIGIYRWAVGNSFGGAPAGSLSTASSGNFGDFTLGTTGNLQFSGTSNTNHSWFFEGVGYRGHSEGIVNSALGVISVTGQASSLGVSSGVGTGTAGGETLVSGFTAAFADSGDGIPVRRFEGIGVGEASVGGIGVFSTIVFGSKVSDQILIFGG